MASGDRRAGGAPGKVRRAIVEHPAGQLRRLRSRRPVNASGSKLRDQRAPRAATGNAGRAGPGPRSSAGTRSELADPVTRTVRPAAPASSSRFIATLTASYAPRLITSRPRGIGATPRTVPNSHSNPTRTGPEPRHAERRSYAGMHLAGQPRRRSHRCTRWSVPMSFSRQAAGRGRTLDENRGVDQPARGLARRRMGKAWRAAGSAAASRRQKWLVKNEPALRCRGPSSPNNAFAGPQGQYRGRTSAAGRAPHARHSFRATRDSAQALRGPQPMVGHAVKT